MKNIAINIIATNKYVTFLNRLCQSISENFTNCNITVIIYTNVDLPENLINENQSIKFIKSHIEHEPWPAPTLKRFSYFLNERSAILDNDFAYYIDADSVFIGDIGDSIYPEAGTVGTLHPCLYDTQGTPERNPNSKAYIPHGSNNNYYCGGFIGGRSGAFIKMSDDINENIMDDLSRGIIAVWHDESHLNRYFFDNHPAITLNHPYAIAETICTRYPESRILFLDKDLIGGHDYFRE